MTNGHPLVPNTSSGMIPISNALITSGANLQNRPNVITGLPGASAQSPSLFPPMPMPRPAPDYSSAPSFPFWGAPLNFLGLQPPPGMSAMGKNGMGINMPSKDESLDF